MSLASQLDRYLSVRRSLGYDLGTSERILRRFTRFADREGVVHINTALFLRWHATLADACPRPAWRGSLPCVCSHSG
jgi:integrase/recombinase XerD